jgi:ABC-type multidrug transport system permease subunit
MLKTTYLLIVDTLRTKSFLFWMVAFPAILMAIFGAVFGGGGEPAKAPVFLYTNSSLGHFLKEVLNETHDLRLVSQVDDPKAFVLRETARLRRPATLVVANGSSIHIYSVSNIWGGIVAGAVHGLVYQYYYPNLTVPVDVKLEIIGPANATSMLVQSSMRTATVLVLVQAIATGITGILAILAGLATLGLNKRAALFRVSKVNLVSSAAAASLLSSFVGIGSVLIVARLYGVDIWRIASSWQVWAAYILNFLFSAGIGLLLTNAVTMRKADINVMTNLGSMMFLTLAFTTGYFYPLEVMPESLARFALAMPTSYTATFATVSVLGGEAPISMLAYPAAAAAAVFALGLRLVKLYSKP